MRLKLKIGKPLGAVQPQTPIQEPVLKTPPPTAEAPVFFPDLEKAAPVPIPNKVYTVSSFPDKVLVKQEGHPRRIKVYGPIWSEVFASLDADQVAAARVVLLKVPMSNYTLLDEDTGERVLFTTDAFYSDARRILDEAGITPWGMT